MSLEIWQTSSIAFGQDYKSRKAEVLGRSSWPLRDAMKRKMEMIKSVRKP